MSLILKGRHASKAAGLAVAATLATLGPGCTRSMRANSHLEKANSFYLAGQFDSAEIEYRNVLQIQPGNAQAISRLGLIYFEDGRLPLAATYLTRARQLEPDNAEAAVDLGRIDLVERKFGPAREEALAALVRAPKDPEGLLILAESAGTPKNIAETREHLKGLQSSDPSGGPVAVALGTLDLEEHNLTAAEDEFHRALELDPKLSSAYVALGLLLNARNDLAGADKALASAAEYAPIRSERRLQYAAFKIRAGDTESALKALDTITNQAPDYLPAWIMKAELASNQRKFDEAEGDLSKVLSRDASNPEALILGARIQLTRGENAKAIDTLERMRKIYPNSAQVDFQLGRAYLASNDSTRAISELNEAVSKQPEFAEANLLLAEAEIRKGDFRSANQQMKQFSEKHPKIPQAQLLLATADRGLGQLNESLEIYQSLEKTYPKNAETPLLEGLVFLQKGQGSDARQAFERSLTADPGYLPSAEQLIGMDLKEKRFPEALERAEAQARNSPKLALTQLLLAKVYLAEGKADPAESALKKAIDLQADSPTAYLLLARLYVATNRQKLALDDLQKAVAENPNDLGELMMLASLESEQKDYASAKSTYEKILSINPRFAGALNNLAYIYSEKLGDQDKAFELAQKAREILPDEPHTADTLGWILFKRHQYPWALSLLQECAAKLPGQADVQYHLGMALYTVGQEQDAKKALERSLQSGSPFADQDSARQRLAVLALDPAAPSPDARAILAKALASQPDDPVALARLAGFDARDGHAEKAIEGYQAALRSSPTYVAAMIGLARIETAQGETQKGLELLKSARKVDPNDSAIARELGLLAFQDRDYIWSASLLQEAAQARPDNARWLFDSALAGYSVGHSAEAVAAMEHAQELGLDEAQAKQARRFLDFVGSDAHATADTIEASLRVDPDYVPALMARARQAEKSDDPSTAVATYKKIVSLYPEFVPAMTAMVIDDALHPIDDATAEDYSVKVSDRDPDDPEFLKASGIVAFRTQDYARASTLLGISSTRASDDALVYYYLGMAQYRLNSPAESKRSLNRALELKLSPDLAAEARDVLTKIK